MPLPEEPPPAATSKTTESEYVPGARVPLPVGFQPADALMLVFVAPVALNIEK